MNTHTTEITLEVEIEYEYDPGEKRVDYYPDGSGYPGTDPSVAILSIQPVNGFGCIQGPLSVSVCEDLQAEILENHDAEGE